MISPYGLHKTTVCLVLQKPHEVITLKTFSDVQNTAELYASIYLHVKSQITITSVLKFAVFSAIAKFCNLLKRLADNAYRIPHQPSVCQNHRIRAMTNAITRLRLMFSTRQIGRN